MTFIPVPSCVSVAIGMVGNNGQTATVVMGVKLASSATLVDCQNISDAVADQLGSLSSRPWSDVWSVTSVRAAALDSLIAPSYLNTFGTTAHPFPIAGSISGGLTLDNAAVIVTLQTGYKGRSFRGRNYWPGIPTSFLLDESHILGSAVAGWNVAVATFIAGMDAAGYPIAVLSRHFGGVPRTAGIATPVISVRAQAKLGTQRRRLAGSFS